MKQKNRLFLTAIVLMLTLGAYAKVKLPHLIADNMVLQRNHDIHIWGDADSNEEIIIKFKGKKYKTTANDQGKWSVMLKPAKAGGPYTMDINDISLKNILIGDVWLCSGQSNIDLTIRRVEDLYKKETDTLRVPSVRLFKVNNQTNIHSTQEEISPTTWHELAPENVENFSSFSYFLARDLYEKTKIPQGVIACSWGGTPIQTWIGAKNFADYPQYATEIQLMQNDEFVKQANATARIADHNWHNLLYKLDKGVHEKWYTTDFDDSSWITISQNKNTWGRDKNGAFNGSYWFRQHIQIDAAHAGKPALLYMGRLIDADSTFVNGQCVGTTGYEWPPRKYQIPAGVLKEGDNVITVRIIAGSNASFVKDKPYKLIFSETDEQQLSENWKFHHGAYMPQRRSYGIGMQNIPSTCYNAMLYPLHKFPISGAVWYQGESNTNRPAEYEEMLALLMKDWRDIWNNETLPFFIVQLPDYMEPSDYPSNSGWVSLRESQRRATVKDENAELVVGLGLGEWNDIHPLRKKEMAERASLEIQKKIYGMNVSITPRLEGGEVKGNQVILNFSDEVLGDINGNLYDFELSDESGKYQNATATANGKQVIITCNDINNPTSVRYAWRNTPPKANLKGKNRLPLPTFQWDK